MSGTSSAVRSRSEVSFLPIIVEKEEYAVGWTKFERSATDTQLLTWTEEVLGAFQALRQAVNTNYRELLRQAGGKSESVSLDQAVTLDPGVCHDQLVTLAKWGDLAYQLFFEDEKAREILAGRFQRAGTQTFAPTFISDKVPFPWEVLYEGDHYEDGDPEMFWGLRYSPARILDRKDTSLYDEVQDSPDMLFCLNHNLRQTHQREWPEIEKLVKATDRGRFRVLGSLPGSAEIHDRKALGKALLEYLDLSAHNMLHFACHCQQGEAGADTLLVSLIDPDTDTGTSAGNEEVAGSPDIIQFDTYTFVHRKGCFQRSPLVFLNACHSAGGADELRETFNLPQVFIKRRAAAVIATACPVPDCFAAAFARQFYAFFLHGQKVTDETTGETTLRLLTIGEALRETRRYFLEKHNNPLGLAYGLYSPANYRLAQSTLAGGSAR